MNLLSRITAFVTRICSTFTFNVFCFVSLFLFLLFSTYTQAQTIFDGLTPQLKVQETNLKYAGFLVGAGQVLGVFVGPDLSLAKVPTTSELCEVWQPNVRAEADFFDGEREDPTSFQQVNPTTLRGTYKYTCEYEFTLSGFNNCGSEPSPCRREASATVDFAVDQVTELTCPNDTFEEQDQCYAIFDINRADSCPDSTQDPTFVLPYTGQTSSTVCQNRPDGSRCQYDLSNDGTYYISNLEGSCYQEQGLEEYDDTGLNQPDETTAECQNIGNGVSACPANEDAVCISGQCPTGCGSISVGGANPTFVCFSTDTDGDGLPDFNDPDIDGDGIPNDQDLDSDGDGIDDPIFDGSQDPAVNIDTRRLEELVRAGNSTLTQISNTLDGGVGGGGGTGNNELEFPEINFTTDEGNRDTSVLDSLFSQEKLEQLLEDTETERDKLRELVSDIRDEGSSIFQLSAPSAAFQARTIAISGRSYDISFSRFASNYALMGTVVLFLAALASLSIILSGSK